MQSPLALRRSELEHWRRTQDAVLEHGHRTAAAYAEYQKAVREIMGGARAKELAALDQAERAGESSEEQAAAAKAAQERNAQTARETEQAILAAQRRLAEEQLKSWYDVLERRRDSLEKYLAAVRAGYAGGLRGGLGGIGVSGDEGSDPAATVYDPQWAYLAGLAGYVYPGATLGIGGPAGGWTNAGFGT